MHNVPLCMQNTPACFEAYPRLCSYRVRPEVTADRIILANDIRNVIVSLIDSMSNQFFGRYTLTRYLLIYLLREALETDQSV